MENVTTPPVAHPDQTNDVRTIKMPEGQKVLKKDIAEYQHPCRGTQTSSKSLAFKCQHID